MKNRFLFAAAIVAGLASAPSLAAADELLGSYVARISWKDHEASDGYKLDTAAQVVRQDRANVHLNIQTDEEDGDDSWFASKASRARLEKMLNQSGAMNSTTRNAILNGEPLIRVDVYRNSVKVKIIG